VVQDLSDIVATPAEDSEDRIAPSSFQRASRKATVCFHVSDLGLDGAAPLEERLATRRVLVVPFSNVVSTMLRTSMAIPLL
jgi:hypothetical protein